MNNVKNEYNKRLSEIELYFDTLALLDNGNCTINCVDIIGNEVSKVVDTKLSTILKANGFLLLYNLVEATISNSIQAVFASIHSSQMAYDELTNEIRRMWIRQEIKHSNMNGVLFNILDKVVNHQFLLFRKDSVNISGNIDAQKIRDISKQFGCRQISDGRDLCTIKDKRNNLAHGDFTFSEIGQSYSMSDLMNFKNSVESYLTNVMNEFELFINKNGYSATNSTY